MVSDRLGNDNLGVIGYGLRIVADGVDSGFVDGGFGFGGVQIKLEVGLFSLVGWMDVRIAVLVGIRVLIDVRVLVDIDVFSGGGFVGKDGGTALHVDFVMVAGGVFVDGVAELVLFFFGDVAKPFFDVFGFGGVGDEVGLEGVGGEYFFVEIICCGHLNSNILLTILSRPVQPQLN